ncbi:uncharacterized protein LOC107274337 isoform X2 [Cephus cinctus]|uniref:Uncharacterized protein LOC107274337 isoform X2 n=1 Tax=Cephus cinctus TaxID=211228 RepID=A0AAJ7RVB0_CEPCN|nr:uncharacterized protein LOC107274337 isoform X2 [Cephus cinctus]
MNEDPTPLLRVSLSGVQILAVLLLSVIPWPGPSVFKISCHRDRASVVRRIVQKKWIPILRKYQVELPLECPFHKSRDVFYPQQAAKHQHRPSQWTCGLCGKSFYAEKHLDAHFDNRHKSNVNTAEDAVCLADYCDIMRCDVFGTRDFESSLAEDSGPLNTDIQVWKESSSQRTSVAAPIESRDLAKTYRDSLYISGDDGSAHESFQQYCQGGSSLDGGYRRGITGSDNKSSDACDNDDGDGNGEDGDADASYKDQDQDEDEDEDDGDLYAEDDDSLVEAALPPGSDRKMRDKAFELRKLKSNCKQEDLQKLKVQCEVLVRDCIAGLLTNLSLRDFQDIEAEMNRAICWYLSCDRYWEDTKRQRHTPWYLLITFLLILLFGMFVCYYVIWVLFNSAEESRGNGASRESHYNVRNDHAGSSSRDSNCYGDGKDDIRGKSEIDVSPASADAPDGYIYVAYPPELKRRLLERTTRL